MAPCVRCLPPLARKALLVLVRRWLVLVLAGKAETVFEFFLDTFAGFVAAKHFLMRSLFFGTGLAFSGNTLAHSANSLHFFVCFFALPLRRWLLPLRDCS